MASEHRDLRDGLRRGSTAGQTRLGVSLLSLQAVWLCGCLRQWGTLRLCSGGGVGFLGGLWWELGGEWVGKAEAAAASGGRAGRVREIVGCGEGGLLGCPLAQLCAAIKTCTVLDRACGAWLCCGWPEDRSIIPESAF